MDAAFAPRAASTTGWNFLFHAEFLDADSGLYNYGYRYLHPQLGRWISRDPIGEKGGWNLFSITHNNLLSNVDFLGLRNKAPDVKVSACTTYIIGGHGLHIPKDENYAKKLKDGKVIDPKVLERSDLPNNVKAALCGASAHVVGCNADMLVNGIGDVSLSSGTPSPNEWNQVMWETVEREKANASKKCGKCCAKIAIIVKVVGDAKGLGPWAFENEDGTLNDEDRKKGYANWTYDCKSMTLTKN
jgi:RHS repeat-associated protein